LRGDIGDVPGVAGRNGVLGIPDPFFLPSLLSLILLLIGGLYVAGLLYLRPRTVGGVWARTRRLVTLAGAELRPGETPGEFGERVAREFPEAGMELKELAAQFVVAAYAPASVAAETRPGVLKVWESLRPLLLRRVVARFKPA